MAQRVSSYDERGRPLTGPGRVDSAAKGKRAERVVADVFRSAGWPESDARRHVRTGDLRTPDEGDIRLPGVTVEVKHYKGGLTEQQIQGFMEKLRNSQCRPGEIGLLVERRDSIAPANAGRWWCHLWATDYFRISDFRLAVAAFNNHVVRIQLQDAVRLLKYAGFCPVSNNPFMDSDEKVGT